jgi:cytochrome P450
VGETVHIGRFAERITADVIADVLFGEQPGHEVISTMLSALTQIVTGPAVFIDLLRRDLGPLSPGRRISNRLAQLEAAITTEIEAARANRMAVNGGLLRALVQHPAASHFTNEELLDEVKTLLAAGHAPTAAAVAWALYWIHADPLVLRRLEDDLASWRTGQFERLMSATGGLPYLDMVCRETLRIIPVVPAVDRIVPERTRFRGHTVDAGTRLVACSYLTHRRPEIFAEPERFWPERFAARAYSPFEYYPFGGGHRRCLGAFFSVFQMKVMLATLLKLVRFQGPRDCGPTVSPRGVIFAPSRALELTVQEVFK